MSYRGSGNINNGDDNDVEQPLLTADEEAVFKTFDEDQSGYIDAVELSHALEAAGKEVDARRLAELMKKLDKDHDSRISKEEFKAFCKSISGRVTKDSTTHLLLQGLVGDIVDVTGRVSHTNPAAKVARAHLKGEEPYLGLNKDEWHGQQKDKSMVHKGFDFLSGRWIHKEEYFFSFVVIWSIFSAVIWSYALYITQSDSTSLVAGCTELADWLSIASTVHVIVAACEICLCISMIYSLKHVLGEKQDDGPFHQMAYTLLVIMGIVTAIAGVFNIIWSLNGMTMAWNDRYEKCEHIQDWSRGMLVFFWVAFFAGGAGII